MFGVVYTSSYYKVLAQRVRVKFQAVRFVIYLLDMLSKLKGDTEIATITSISPISIWSNY